MKNFLINVCNKYHLLIVLKYDKIFYNAFGGEKMNVAAVLAGGSGTRMGTDIPKQFLEIEGVPVIIRSINAFIKHKDVDVCIVSVAQSYIDYTNELIGRFIESDKEIFVTGGGKTRSDTLFSVLQFMKKQGILDGSIVLTHDAVRPFINDRIISDNIEAAKKYGACNTCIPAVDTMLLSDDGEFITAVPDRSRLFHAQTPQSFDASELYGLITMLSPDVFSSLTDGCSVYSHSGKRVYMVKGENYNIKITYPDDIGRSENIIKQYFS